MAQVANSKQVHGFLSALGRVAGRGLQSVNAYVSDANDRAAARASRGAEDLALVAAAEKRLPELIAALKEGYVPSVTQAKVNALPWDHPDPVAGLLSVEVGRIADEVELVFRAAGFPLANTDKALRRRMGKSWAKALAEMHSFVFGRLKLPNYFTFFDGVLDFELVNERRAGGLVTEFYGQHSGYFYNGRPTLS